MGTILKWILKTDNLRCGLDLSSLLRGSLADSCEYDRPILTGKNYGDAQRATEYSKRQKLTGSLGHVTADAQNRANLCHLRMFRSL
jgi:hypothetical protein